mmetsp:Transcript_463/g.1070  ORF Transcript_463/g.1070 Transcript_463/m.1070 type:complete len:210 (-) Transcript_463:8-637(-)
MSCSSTAAAIRFSISSCPILHPFISAAGSAPRLLPLPACFAAVMRIAASAPPRSGSIATYRISRPAGRRPRCRASFSRSAHACRFPAVDCRGAAAPVLVAPNRQWPLVGHRSVPIMTWSRSNSVTPAPPLMRARSLSQQRRRAGASRICAQRRNICSLALCHSPKNGAASPAAVPESQVTGQQCHGFPPFHKEFCGRTRRYGSAWHFAR